MAHKADEIQEKILDVITSGDYDLFEVLLALAQTQEGILSALNTGDLTETTGYESEVTSAQRDDIQKMIAEEYEQPEPPSLASSKTQKQRKKSEPRSIPDDLDFGDIEDIL